MGTRQLSWDLSHEEITQERIDALVAEMREIYLRDDRPWVVGYSGGKDSTAVNQLVFRTVDSLPTELRTKTVHVISSDTQVENPEVTRWLHQCHDELREVAERQGLPVELAVVYPNPRETFWVLLLGRGYPAPTSDFRWCTGRLKIDPAEAHVLTYVEPEGRILQLLGSRKAESKNRAASIEAHAIEGKFGTTGSLTSGMSYQPIQDWDNDNVWEYLRLFPKPWGGDNEELFQLYQSAHGGECVLDFDRRTASCGGSRFGCWTCTVVEQDKSMTNMVRTTNPEYSPLLAFRQKILDYRRDRSKRNPIGRNGKIRHHTKTGEVTPGPYYHEVRLELLRDLFEIERGLPGFATLTEDDLRWIRYEWEKDGGPVDELDRLMAEYRPTVNA